MPRSIREVVVACSAARGGSGSGAVGVVAGGDTGSVGSNEDSAKPSATATAPRKSPSTRDRHQPPGTSSRSPPTSGITCPGLRFDQYLAGSLGLQVERLFEGHRVLAGNPKGVRHLVGCPDLIGRRFGHPLSRRGR